MRRLLLSAALADVSPDASFYEVFRVTGTSAAQPTISGVACSLELLNISYAEGAFVAFVASNVSGLLTMGFTGTAGGMRGLQVWRTSCTDPDAVFHPAFLSSLAGRCSVLRFLDFAAINDATIANWTDRVPVTWPQWAGGLRPYAGAPWEAAISMANAIGADVWVQVPLTANDEYVVALATLLQVRGHAWRHTAALLYATAEHSLRPPSRPMLPSTRSFRTRCGTTASSRSTSRCDGGGGRGVERWLLARAPAGRRRQRVRDGGGRPAAPELRVS